MAEEVEVVEQDVNERSGGQRLRLLMHFSSIVATDGVTGNVLYLAELGNSDLSTRSLSSCPLLCIVNIPVGLVHDVCCLFHFPNHTEQTQPRAKTHGR